MGDIKWSASRIDAFNYCRMRGWLKYVEHAPSSRLPVFPKGTVLHDGIEHFWSRLGESYEQIYTKSGNKRNIPQKYYGAESFGKYLMGKWGQEVARDRILREEIKQGKYYDKALERAEKRLIAWTHKEQPYEIKYQIRDAAKVLFDIFMEEGQPEYSELKFDFVLRDLYFPDNPKNVFDLNFSGFIDDIRLRDGKVVVRDYKSGKPWVDKMKIKHDPQLTLYNIGLCSLVLRNDEMAERLGLKERRKEYMGNPLFIDPEFIEEFFMIEAPLVSKRMLNKNPKVDEKRLPKTLHSINRTDGHFFELIRMIKGTEESVEKGVIYAERGRKCDGCDMQVACEAKLEDALLDREPQQSNGQLLIDDVASIYEKKLVIHKGRPPVTKSEPVYVLDDKAIHDQKKAQRIINFKRKTPY